MQNQPFQTYQISNNQSQLELQLLQLQQQNPNQALLEQLLKSQSLASQSLARTSTPPTRNQNLMQNIQTQQFNSLQSLQNQVNLDGSDFERNQAIQQLFQHLQNQQQKK